MSADSGPPQDEHGPHMESPAADSFDLFQSLPTNVVENTLRILEHKDAVRQLDPDHYEIVSLRTPSRRVRVHRRGDVWRCRVDRENNQDRPCGHILAVLIHRGDVTLPNTAASVWKKGNEPRNHSAEARAWELVATRGPELLARLLRDGLPVLAPEAAPVVNALGGRPRKPLYPQVYQAVLRVAWRQSHHAARGALNATDHKTHNPYGNVGVATLSRFLNDRATTPVLEKLLALTTWPARAYETLVHPDGTGLTEQHFSAYFDERYTRRKKDEDFPLPDVVPSPGNDPWEVALADAIEATLRGALRPHLKGWKPHARLHHWTYATILWTYHYTLIAALYAQQGPFGEAPWLIPLVERARLTLDLKEVGGDKAYDANYNYQYAKETGLDAQIKIRRPPLGARFSYRKRARKRHAFAAKLDPHGYAAKANRRNNAETGNHAFKAILGDQIYSKNATAQRNEILCMAIAYNLTRLVYLEVERGIQCDFAPGAQALANAAWVPLDELRSRVPTKASGVRPEWT